MQEIKVIAFDADDTLWDNQVFYDEVESEFCRLLSEYGTAEEVSSRLFDQSFLSHPIAILQLSVG